MIGSVLTEKGKTMDDLISRQAAIEAVNRLSLGETDAVRLSMRIADYLNRMPPAQPEIIRCKDCRHRIVNDYYGEKLNIKGYCELDTGDPFELGRDAQNDDWFCADAERRTDE